MNTKKNILDSNKLTTDYQEENDSYGQIDDIVQSLKTHLSRGLLVPLICEDMYEFAAPGSDETQSLHEYIVEQVIRHCKSKLNINEEELDDILSKGYYGIELLEDKIDSNIYEDIYNTVLDEDRLRKGIRLKPQVQKFLEVCQFPLIITTNCFPIIEENLEGYHSEFFRPESKNETPITPKCVYHLFGEATPNNDNWGYDERQILKFLKYAYSSEYSFSNLIAYIANNNSKKSLLILGNDTPNWLFRFILSPVYPGDVYDRGNGFYMTENIQEEDRCLTHFLKKIHFKKDTKIMDILEVVTNKMKEPNPKTKTESVNEYDIFISHASEDNKVVEKLVESLKSKGIKNVWVDYDSIHNGPYWERIIDGLKKAKYFMPLITEDYISKTKPIKEQQCALRELGITELSFTSKQAHDIDKQLGGVATELILSKEIFQGNQSLPVILANSTYFDEPLTSKRVDNWAEKSKRLPESLFYGISMFEFDENDPEKLNLDLNRIATN